MNIRELESVRNEQFIYLSTTGRSTGKVHTVELWFALGPGGAYLSHEGSSTDWMKNIRKQPRVSARIAGLAFEADARVVGNGPSREEGKKVLYEKYYGPATGDVIDDWFSLSQVIQLRPV